MKLLISHFMKQKCHFQRGVAKMYITSFYLKGLKDTATSANEKSVLIRKTETTKLQEALEPMIIVEDKEKDENNTNF